MLLFSTGFLSHNPLPSLSSYFPFSIFFGYNSSHFLLFHSFYFLNHYFVIITLNSLNFQPLILLHVTFVPVFSAGPDGGLWFPPFFPVLPYLPHLGTHGGFSSLGGSGVKLTGAQLCTKSLTSKWKR